MPLLEIKNVKKYYSTPRGLLHAVDDVTMNIEKGKTIGIVGESGCGKSTLGKTLIRMEDATAGEIWFDGQEITGMQHHEFRKMRMKMQMIFQDPYSSLDPRMSVYQLIAEPIQTYKLAQGKKDLEEKVFGLMEEVGLAKRLSNSYPHELDGGRRQRIGIARALSLDPEFIVCDEPVSALDVSIQAQILNLLMDLQKDKDLTYMFITHDMSVVKHISDDIAVMYLGQVVEKAGFEELFARPLHPYSKALFSAIPVPSIHNRRERILLKGEITSPVNPKPCCRFAARCPHAEDICRQTEPKLRDMGNGHFCKCHRAGEV
ncbi:ABC transporter ATP-binding protein [Murimonas intestini]|uniref:Oligopeptide/dipeptide ABC transporter ATP-binding protein n=1 Tax=Murimonas intestini TaxID=1337051 RepID=A0AB73T0X5_9FIRM|nr:ATP-binding cassette domain-containing protein [Murimonas intestini]MCR1867570.1 ATP-binding cassette domain-containing protein [Murimonas intestini]MCR1885015.1 ATP-binding cassette domain-containing protein [Murimonas intestini]